MYFTIKIIRFLIGLVIKIALLPVRLLQKLLGKQRSDSEAGSVTEPASGSVDGAVTSADTDSTPSDSAIDVRARAKQAKTNIERFRKGMLVVGTLQLLLLLSLFTVVPSGLLVSTSGLLVSATGVSVVTALLQITSGLKLQSYPSGLWYIGMGICGLGAVISLSAFPSGLVGTTVYGALGYFGYTGRPALSTFKNSTSADQTQHSSTDTGSETVQPSSSSTANTATAGTESAAVSAVEDETTSPTSASNESTARVTATKESEKRTNAEAPDDPTATAETDISSATTVTEADKTDNSDDTVVDPDTETDALDRYRQDLTATDPEERQSAVVNLMTATQQDAVPSQAAIDALTERLNDDAAAVRVAACRSLGNLGAEQAKPMIKELRLDMDSEVSRAASQALRRIE